ncbi:MAG: hypothetical protein HZC42_06320 [Candidatus Eisenbacteria bacterium]|nr:hypothetical protein [Candidatus Eisenbacteria bacterium]
MSRPPAKAGRARPARPPAPAAPPPLPPAHPAALAALLVAAACVALSVSYTLYDTDLWQHLTVGRSIWELHRFPTRQVWAWPTYGTPDVDYAWGFEALLWPVWRAGGAWGLFAWRWAAALVSLGLAWAAARRMGARGLTPLVVVVACSLVLRQRLQVRPESIAAILFAATLWILETRRHGGPDRSAWLVAIALAWANVHISYYLLFVLVGIHAVAAHLARPRPAAAPGRLWMVALACLAVSFVNPFGWRALWQPFEYFLVWRHEPAYALIGELRAIAWSVNWKSGLPVLLALWPALALTRGLRRGARPDRIELATCALLTAQALSTQRFLGTWSLAAAAYLSRDLDEWMRARRAPSWAAGAWTRAGLAAAACVAVGLLEWSRPELPVGVRMESRWLPVAGCDFVERTGVRGRAFNPFDFGGYLLYRFWPQHDRLPFMGIHLEGTRVERDLYAAAMTRPGIWPHLDRRYRFDWCLLRRAVHDDPLLASLDADSAWAQVFSDDAAVLFVRRSSFPALARDSAYRVVPADPGNVRRLGARAAADSALRAAAARELARQVAGSPWHAGSLGLLANIALIEGRLDDGRSLLERALAVDPFLPRARERLGLVALARGRPREALRQFEDEWRLNGWTRGLDLRRGQVAQAEGDLRKARDLYRRELRRDPGNAEAGDSLASVERRLGS